MAPLAPLARLNRLAPLGRLNLPAPADRGCLAARLAPAARLDLSDLGCLRPAGLAGLAARLVPLVPLAPVAPAALAALAIRRRRLGNCPSPKR